MGHGTLGMRNELLLFGIPQESIADWDRGFGLRSEMPPQLAARQLVQIPAQYLEHDARWNRHHALALCLSMISAQTRSAFVARENRFPLFRIMLLGCGSVKKP